MRAGREITFWKEVWRTLQGSKHGFMWPPCSTDTLHALWLRQILKSNWSGYKFITNIRSDMTSLLHVYSVPSKMVTSLHIRVLNVWWKHWLGNYFYKYFGQEGVHISIPEYTTSLLVEVLQRRRPVSPFLALGICFCAKWVAWVSYYWLRVKLILQGINLPAPM